VRTIDVKSANYKCTTILVQARSTNNFPTGQGSTEEQGQDVVLRLEKAEQTFVLTEVAEKPVLSALRSFSAPIKLEVSCAALFFYSLFYTQHSLSLCFSISNHFFFSFVHSSPFFWFFSGIMDPSASHAVKTA